MYIAGTYGGNVFIAKYNTTREVAWNHTRVSAISADITDIAVDASGNIFIVGTLDDGDGNLSAYLAMYDTYGNSHWNHTWRKLTVNYGYGIDVDNLGNVYLAGSITDDWYHIDAFLAKYNAAGNSVWNRTWDKNTADEAKAVAVDSSGDICITGSSGSSPFAAKYYSNGTSAWNQSWNPTGSEGLSVAFDPLGNVFVGGSTYVGTSIAAFITKYSSAGVLQWNHTWNGENDERGYGVCADATGAYLVGYTNSYGNGGTDAFINKYDPNGNLVCNTTWGGNFGDDAWSVIPDGSGGIYIAGRTGGFGATSLTQAFVARMVVSWVSIPDGNPFPVEYIVTIVVVAGVAAVVLVVFMHRRAKLRKKPATK